NKKMRLVRRFKAPEISLTPLIDVALTLLVIFIVTAPMVQNGIRVDLPQGKSREVGREQDFVVTLDKNNQLYFNAFPVKYKDLISTVQTALKNNDELPVYIKADESVSYGKVIEVVDELKMAGIKYVAMSTRPG
ncbi:biopolymer transporter ExbD, partial [Candidatus Dependentiae bacterium]|nr:biopolymer transporter ExbD [Candidatus Dependentiae bacterium]